MPGQIHPTLPGVRPDSYIVRRGDALILIAKKFGITVYQLKTFNGLTDNLIRAGDTLKIPSLEEAKAIAPPPEPVKKITKGQAKPKATPSDANDRFGSIPLQVFLDREGFSAGPIESDPGMVFGKVVQLYQGSHDDAKDITTLTNKARSRSGRWIYQLYPKRK